jgi:hypothetical protein
MIASSKWDTITIEVAYPAASVERGADGSVVERDEIADVVDVGAGAVREHGAAPGEAELVAVDVDPVLHRLLDGELLVRDVGEPGDVAAGRPRERGAVAVGRRHEAPQPLGVCRGAVALTVDEPVAREPEGALHVLAGRVLGVLGGARVVGAAARRGLRPHPLGGVVRGEVERRGGRGGGGRGLGGAGDGGGDGDGGAGVGGRGEAAVVPDAEEVGHGAEDGDGREVEQRRAPPGRREVQLREGRAHRHGCWVVSRAGFFTLPCPVVRDVSVWVRCLKHGTRPPRIGKRGLLGIRWWRRRRGEGGQRAMRRGVSVSKY